MEGGLPGVVGMSADKRGAGMEPWATESVRVSGSVNFSKYSANGRYSDGDGAPLVSYLPPPPPPTSNTLTYTTTTTTFGPHVLRDKL